MTRMMCKVGRNFIFFLLVGVAMQTGCCKKQSLEVPGTAKKTVLQGTTGDDKTTRSSDEEVKPLNLLDATGLNYSIDGRSATGRSAPVKAGSFFEKQYLEGVEMMEKGEFTQAINVFDELIKRYPNSEEASIAELCIAELHFRSKANELALRAYERIVEHYPNSQAAENARSGIDYLRNIERYENEFISPDAEARKRRGY